MDLNQLIRKMGGVEPEYRTPMAVVKTMAEETDAARVAQIQPPYEHYYRQVPDTSRTFKKTWHVLGLYFTISNCRVKKRHACGYCRTKQDGKKMWHEKQRLMELSGGRCPLCHARLSLRTAELHHILPYARFEDLANDERNLMLLCHDCHKEIHCNPWRNAHLMQQKARELGIDLDERYNRQPLDGNDKTTNV